MLFDSHAHLDDEKFAADRDEVIARARAAGVRYILNAGADLASSAAAAALADKYPEVYAAVGVHPHDAKTATTDTWYRLAELAGHPKAVAVGEIGLDYHYDHSPRDVQRAVFIRALDLARQMKKPVIIHDREAHGDVLAIVKKEGKGLSGVFHCFSGSLEMAREVIKLGFYVSFAGPVTFANAAKLREVAKEVPLSRLLVETDCPYLAPQPHRGQRNEPAHVQLVAAAVAGIRGMDVSDLGQAAAANAMTLFGIGSG